MPWLQTLYYAQLRLPDKGRVIKGLVIVYVDWLRSMKGIGWILGQAQSQTQQRCEDYYINGKFACYTINKDNYGHKKRRSKDTKQQ